jgi:hypothetical protein
MNICSEVKITLHIIEISRWVMLKSRKTQFSCTFEKKESSKASYDMGGSIMKLKTCLIVSLEFLQAGNTSFEKILA